MDLKVVIGFFKIFRNIDCNRTEETVLDQLLFPRIPIAIGT